ncbi:hypothetical protein SLA2020_387820 [Shorea laevis]
MASTTATWSPSSLQLRLVLNCRKSPAILVRTRLGRLDRRVRVLCVAHGEARNGNASDKTVDGFLRMVRVLWWGRVCRVAEEEKVWR